MRGRLPIFRNDFFIMSSFKYDIAGRVLCTTCNEKLRGIVSALNINMLTATETTPDTGGCNELTNAHNAESRLPKVNIIVAAPLAE